MLNNISVMDKLKTLNRRDLMIFLIPLIVFSFYLYVFAPGIMVYDSFNQIHQIATGEFINWHPFFHTFIEMLCLKVYGSPASVAVLQIVIFSIMWMIICKYNRDDSVKSKIFILQIVITLVISLVPINPIYAINLQKDILFSYFLLFLCFLMQVLVDRKGKASIPLIIAIAVSMAFVAQLRHNGMILVMVFIVILTIWMYVKNRDLKMTLAVPALAVVCILLISSLNFIYDVDDHQKDPMSDIVGHMLVDYDMTLKIDPDDQVKLDKLMSKKDIKKHYNIYWKDPTRGEILDKKVWKENRSEYIDIAIKYSLRHPFHCIKYFLKSAPLVWDITRDEGWSHAQGVVYTTNMDSQRRVYYNKNNQTPVTDFDNASVKNVGNPVYEQINGWVNSARDNFVLDTLFYSPALYMYLSLIILVVIYWITRLRSLWLIYIPNLLNIAIVLVSIPAQQNRYLYPNLLVGYLLIIMLVSILVKRKYEVKG